MKNFWVSLMAVAVLLSGAPMDGIADEPEIHHHEHEGVTDALPGESGHYHGDADDHHENPDDDCHHHVIHCCCTHAHTFVFTAIDALLGAGLSERLAPPAIQAASNLFARPSFHVPIA